MVFADLLLGQPRAPGGSSSGICCDRGPSAACGERAGHRPGSQRRPAPLRPRAPIGARPTPAAPRARRSTARRGAAASPAAGTRRRPRPRGSMSGSASARACASRFARRRGADRLHRRVARIQRRVAAGSAPPPSRTARPAGSRAANATSSPSVTASASWRSAPASASPTRAAQPAAELLDRSRGSSPRGREVVVEGRPRDAGLGDHRRDVRARVAATVGRRDHPVEQACALRDLA